MNNIYDDTMNNNEPDYEGNLAFPPQEESVEKKCEKLKKQLKIAVELLDNVEDWFTGLVGILNNEYAEHNKIIPLGNFEYSFKQHAERINKTIEQIKDLDK